jgi:ABC-2 type transport system ATP-binding protein
MSDIVVETHDLSRKFGKFIAVDRLNIAVKRGEIFGFLGANGAGKTTAIRMLCGLLVPTSGSGIVAGFDIVKQTEKIKSRIGYMSQKFSLYNDLKVEENLEFYGGAYGLDNSKLKHRIEETLVQMQLTEVRSKLTGKIPLGWKQKLALGASLMHNPDIVFLDEATGGVDPVARRAFWDMIHELTSTGKTIFVTTHYMDEAEYCHRISIMHQSRVLVQGPVGELKQQYGMDTVEDLFKYVVTKGEVQ